MDLRCGSNKLHAVIDDDIVEVRCQSRWCGHKSGVVVIHRFNKNTGELVQTLRFSDPSRKEQVNGNSGQGVSVRTA